MGQTLTHGIYLPDEGERNCYNGLAANWQLLDTSVGTIAEHTTALAGKAPAVHTHTKSQITDFPVYGTTAGTICEGNDSRLSDARTPVAHTHTKSDVTDLLNSNFIPSSDANYTLGSSDLRWKQIWCSGYKTKSGNIDFTDSTTTGSAQSWWIDAMEKNGTGFFGVGSIRSHSAGLNEEHFRIKNAGGKWADLYIQLGDNNQFTIGTSTSSNVTNNGFKGKFTPLDSFIPNANNSYDLGSSSYQWNNLYAKNYFYNGTAWGLDKQNEWTNFNRVPGYRLQIKSSSQDIGVIPTGSNQWNGLQFVDKDNDTTFSFQQAFMTSGETRCSMTMVNNSTSSNSAVNIEYLRIYNYLDESFACFGAGVRPLTNNTYDLGTSTNKWKSLNGVNPGALSLPDYSKADGLDVSAQGLNWDLTGATVNTYTPTFDGYLSLRCKDTNGDFLIAAYGGSNAVIRNCAVGTGILPGTAGLCLLIPMLASTPISIRVKATTNFKAYIIPCFGNV